MGKGKVRVTYVPAHSKAQINAARKAHGAGKSKFKAMDAFLMSQRIQDVSDDAAKDIATKMREITQAKGAVKSGDYLDSFSTEVTEPIVAAGNPRRAAKVVNDSDHAAAVEFGNSRTPEGQHIMGEARDIYHTPRGIA